MEPGANFISAFPPRPFIRPHPLVLPLSLFLRYAQESKQEDAVGSLVENSPNDKTTATNHSLTSGNAAEQKQNSGHSRRRKKKQ